MLAGGAILFPSLALLFRLALAGRLHDDDTPPPEAPPAGVRHAPSGLLARTAGASFLAGLGLLTFADAGWAHAVGLASLAVFAVTGFLAIVGTALAD